MAAYTSSTGKKAVWDKLTPEDRECADFMAILMFVAHALEEVRNSANLPVEEAVCVALQSQRTVLKLANRLFPEPDQMQERVIAFADRLGFDIKQQYFPLASNAIH